MTTALADQLAYSGLPPLQAQLLAAPYAAPPPDAQRGSIVAENFTIPFDASGSADMAFNAYQDLTAGAWHYLAAGPAARLQLLQSGGIAILTASAGAAGALVPSWTTAWSGPTLVAADSKR